MTRLRSREVALSILAVIFFNVIVSSAGEAAVEDVLAELNAKSPEERQRLIAENAKKEGEVTLYTAVNMRDAQELMAGFNKSYPGIRVAISSLGGPGVLNKVLTENRAGANLADVVVLNGISAAELIDKKIVTRYKSPWWVFFVRVLSTPKATGRVSMPSATRLSTITAESRQKMCPGDTKICFNRAGKII